MVAFGVQEKDSKSSLINDDSEYCTFYLALEAVGDSSVVERRVSDRKVAGYRFDSRVGSASLYFWKRHLKGIQVKFFTVDQNVWISLACILTKFELSVFCRFQDIAVQSQQFSSYFSFAILPVL